MSFAPFPNNPGLTSSQDSNNPGLAYPDSRNPWIGRVLPRLIARVLGQGATTPSTPAIDTTGVNLLVVAVSGSPPAPNFVLSDSKANVWVALAPFANGTLGVQLFACFNPIVGAGHTFTITGANVFASFEVLAFANASNADGTSSGVNGSTTPSTVQTGLITPARRNALVVSAWGQQGGAPQQPDGSGFVVLDNIVWSPGAFFGLGVGYALQASPASYGITWKWAGGDQPACAAIAGFS